MGEPEKKPEKSEYEKLEEWIEGEWTLAGTPKPQHVGLFSVSPTGTVDKQSPINQRVLGRNDEPKDVLDWAWKILTQEVHATKRTQVFSVRLSREGTPSVRHSVRVKAKRADGSDGDDDEAADREDKRDALDFYAGGAGSGMSGGLDVAVVRMFMDMLRAREEFLREMTQTFHGSMAGVQTQWQTLNSGLMETNRHLATALSRERDKQVEVRAEGHAKSLMELELEAEREKAKQAAEERAAIFKQLGMLAEAGMGRMMGGPQAPAQGGKPGAAAPSGGIVVTPRAAHTLRQMKSLFASTTPEQRVKLMESLDGVQLVAFSEIAKAVSEEGEVGEAGGPSSDTTPNGA